MREKYTGKYRVLYSAKCNIWKIKRKPCSARSLVQVQLRFYTICVNVVAESQCGKARRADRATHRGRLIFAAIAASQHAQEKTAEPQLRGEPLVNSGN